MYLSTWFEDVKFCCSVGYSIESVTNEGSLAIFKTWRDLSDEDIAIEALRIA